MPAIKYLCLDSSRKQPVSKWKRLSPPFPLSKLTPFAIKGQEGYISKKGGEGGGRGRAGKGRKRVREKKRRRDYPGQWDQKVTMHSIVFSDLVAAGLILQWCGLIRQNALHLTKFLWRLYRFPKIRDVQLSRITQISSCEWIRWVVFKFNMPGRWPVTGVYSSS